MPDIKVGTPVSYKSGDVLMRKGKYEGSGDRSWSRSREYGGPASPRDEHEFHGFIIGQRTLSNGSFSRGYTYRTWEGEVDGDPDEYTVKETLQAYLIVTSLRNSPVRVRIEDVTILEDN